MNNLNLSSGAISFGDEVYINVEAPTVSAYEIPESHVSIINNKNHECFFEIKDCDISERMDFQTMNISSGWTIQSEIPIMINARWHKKPRIRKKWLKRYGMKKDNVKVIGTCDSLTNTPNDYDIHLEQYHEFEFTLSNLKYILRPDQIRRGLVIEYEY